MRRRGRKWLSLLLALCMVVTMLPAMSVPAAAADGNCTGDHSGWTELSGSKELKSLSGNYVLTGDVTVTGTDKGNIEINSAVTLCLNGYTLNLNGGNCIRIYEYGSLTLCDCKGGGKITGSSGPGVMVYGGSFIMNGGTITGNSGGGVQVGSVKGAASFTMNGGSITGNIVNTDTAPIGSGGVYVAVGGSFTMNGGSITGNTVTGTATTTASGGVLVANDSSFTMTGGEITNNQCTVSNIFGDKGNDFAGGVRVSVALGGGTVTVSGDAAISGNTAKGSANNVSLANGQTIKIGSDGLTGGEVGVTMANTGKAFTTGGGANSQKYFFSDNDAYVVVPSGGELMLGQLANYPQYAHSHPVCGDNSCSQHGAVVTYDNSLTAMGGALSAGNYYLKHSVTATDDITISGAVNLCLNGKTLNLDGHHFIVNSGGSLTLCDCGTTGKITGQDNTAANVGNGSVYVQGGSFTMYSGSISGNKTYSGGGVDVNDGGSFLMYGGTISGNNATFGSGVNVSGGTFTMSGGSITGNKASGNGGGVFVSSGTFTMSGGSITGNETGNSGGGVFVSGGSFTLSGAPTITGNMKSSAANNVYLFGSCVITIGGQLTGGTIGVTMKTPGEFTSGWKIHMDTVAPTDYFASDSTAREVMLDSSGEVMLHQHSYTYTAVGDTITESCTCGHKATAKVFVPEGTDLTYTGSAIEPAEVTYSDSWRGGKNLPITYSQNTNAGTATASITKNGQTAKVTFTITAKPYDSSFTISDIDDQIYTGKQITPDVIVKDGDKTLTKGTDYDLEYGTNTAAGTNAGSVTVKFKGNYSGSATVNFNIVYAEFPGGTTNDTVFDDYTNTSDWSNSGSVTFETQDGWTVSTTPDGDYKESVTFDDEQDGEHTKTVYVKDSTGKIYETEITYKLDKTAPEVSALTADNTEWTADDVTVSFTASDATSGIENVTVKKPDGTTETLTGSGGDYSFPADSNGAYTVTVTDNAGNTTTQEITISNIDKTQPILNVSGGMESAKELTLTVSASNPGGSGYTVTVKKDNGEAETITGNEYKITEPGTYIFTATTGAGVPITVTKTVHSIAFDSTGGSSVDRQLVVSGGKVTQPADPTRIGYTFDCWQSGQNEWNFGSQVTTNLTLTAAWTLNVPTVTLNADKNNVTYGECITLTAGASHAAGNGIDFTYEWYKDGTKLNGKTASTLTLENVADSGEYKVVVTARDKNGLTATAEDTVTVAIGKATPTLTVSAAEITYGDSLSDSQLTGTADHNGVNVEGSFTWQNEDAKPAVSDSGVTAYTVVFTPDDTANYTSATTTITLTVNRKVLTPTVNTVADKTYDGNTATTGTIALSGAVGTENPTATGVFTFVDANAGTGKQVTVTVSLGDGWDSNYVLSQTELTTTAAVEKKTVGLTWSGYENLVYNGEAVSVAAAANGLVEEDDCIVAVTGGAEVSAGTYTAKATGLSNGNYQLPTSGTAQEYTIAPRPVTLSWDEDSFTYDGTEKTVTATIDNLVSGDSCQLTYKDNEKTNAGSYKAEVTAVGNANYTLTGGTGLTHDWSIGKKTITGTWENTKQVYGDGSTTAILPDGLEAGDSADDIHYHYTGTTADGTIYNSDEPPTEAGTYTITASADNYEITNGTATLVIEKKPVTVTVTDNAVTPGGKPTIDVPELTEGEDYTVTYKDKDGNEADLSKPGNYEVWVKFPENSNYRHSDGSTEAQVGSVTVSETKPAMYTVTFDGNGKTSGTMPDLELAGGSVLTLPVCDYVKTGHQFTGWLYGGKIYQPGDQVTAAYGDMTFAAQWQAVFTVSGTVTEKTEGADTPEVKNAVVSLWLGANKINETSTNENGSYSFDNLIPGIYNLVVSKDERTVTSMVEITTEDRTCNAVLPQYVTNSIVDVTPGSPDIVVGNLDEVFHDTNGADYTEDDAQNVQQNGGKVEITFTVDEQQENDVGEETVKELQSAGGGNLSLFLDCTLTKVVTDQNNGTTETELSQSSVLLEILLPLPAELQGKYSYTISRMHDGKAQIVPQGESSKNEDGEYFTVSEDKTVLVLHVKNFSTYAVGYRNAPSTPTYPPVKNESENGSYTVSPSSPSNGEKVTITPKPDEGYVVGSVTVTDKNGRDVAVTPNTDGTYTFTQPSGSVTITVTFRKDTGVADCPRDETCPMAAFVDLNPNAWYHDGVHYCLEEELMNGVGSGAFAPNGTTSRAMIATILWRLEGSPVVNYLMTYEDVDQDQWYTEAVRWAASVGVVTGYSSEAFGPDDPITREQLAAMLYRYAVYKGYDVRVGGNTNILSYSDASEISEYAVSTIQWACGAGIINGIGNGQLDPKGSSTRAQAATMLMRFCVL